MNGANLDRARSFLAAGGVDNRAVFEQGDAVDIAHEYDALRRVLTGEAATLAETAVAESARRGTAGVVEYLETVREDPDFETTLLALGDGVAVTTRTRR